MHEFIAWCGFFGAWLLVAGPVYQAALELQEEDIERDALDVASKTVPPARPVSPWWWLLPPVGYWLHRRRSQAYRQAVMQALPREQLDAMVGYIEKATGWLFVGLGGLLIATKETWELRAAYEWPDWAFWSLLALMALLAVLNTAGRMARSRSLLADNPNRA